MYSGQEHICSRVFELRANKNYLETNLMRGVENTWGSVMITEIGWKIEQNGVRKNLMEAHIEKK